MGRLRIAATECNYKEIDRQLKEQFKYRINDGGVMVETIKKYTKVKKMLQKMLQVIKYIYGQSEYRPKEYIK